MKSFKIKFVSCFFLIGIMVAGLTSCSESNDGDGTPPVIEKVGKADDVALEPVTVGYANNVYIIHGSGFRTTQKIYFNDRDTYFNSTMVTDTDIVVTIDKNTPYADVPNKLKVVTAYGEAEFDFVIAPPAPELHSFQPVNADDGDQVTIYGNFFLDPVVTVGDTEATVVSNSLTEIVIVLPPGSKHKKISVSTISGDSTWNTAVGTAIYDDAFYDPWTIESWNNHEYITDRAKAYQGTKFIKKTISGWDNIQGNWAWNEHLSEYTGIHFSLRSDDPGKLIWIVNGNGWSMDSHVIITTPEWKEVRLTWADLGGMPAALQNISFQEYTGSTHNYYIDNIGFTVD